MLRLALLAGVLGLCVSLSPGCATTGSDTVTPSTRSLAFYGAMW